MPVARYGGKKLRPSQSQGLGVEVMDKSAAGAVSGQGVSPGVPLSRRLKAGVGAAKAHLRALAHGSRLAPGTLHEPDAQELADPRFLMKLNQKYGPILRARVSGKVTTCIFGIPQGRRFLVEHDNSIEGATTNFIPLFPHGSLRQMTGEPHREYRRLFAEAFMAVDIDEHSEAIRSIIDDMLAKSTQSARPLKLGEVQIELKRRLSEILFRLVLGIPRDWPQYERLLAVYEIYAPHGTVNTVRSEHRHIYDEMKDFVVARADELRSGAEFSSLLGHFAKVGKLDDTVIGNLLQMTEAGRFDTMGLWSWVIKMLGDNMEVLDRIAAVTDKKRRVEFCEAVAQETLRLEQAEFLMRRATSDIVFEGYFIPKGTMVRVAIWAAHKDPNNFEDPFRFNPDRFMESGSTKDIFAPLGLGKHRCLGADWVITMSAMLVEQAALGYRWSIVEDAEPERGRFHFEPSQKLAVLFRAAA
jgi:cytochrome P450